MTELDEIVLVAKMAWALRHVADPAELDYSSPLTHFYEKVGVDIWDYRDDIAIRLDRKAKDSEKHRRALAQTKVPA